MMNSTLTAAMVHSSLNIRRKGRKLCAGNIPEDSPYIQIALLRCPFRAKGVQKRCKTRPLALQLNEDFEDCRLSVLSAPAVPRNEGNGAKSFFDFFSDVHSPRLVLKSKHFYNRGRPGWCNHSWKKIAEHPLKGAASGRCPEIDGNFRVVGATTRRRYTLASRNSSVFEWAMVIFMPRNYTFLPRNF